MKEMKRGFALILVCLLFASIFFVSYVSAAVPINGVCSTTEAQICIAGRYVGVSDNTTDERWICYGLEGGNSMRCSKRIPFNGLCSTTLVDTCTVGTPGSSTVSETATLDTWSCVGTDGGTTVPCSMAVSLIGVCSETTVDTCTGGGTLTNVDDSTIDYRWSCTKSQQTVQCSLAKPMSLGSSIGEKIRLWENSAIQYGIGIRSGEFAFYKDPIAKYAFYDGNFNANDPVMTIDKDGNVGIGTTTPNVKLTVGGILTGLNFPSTLGVLDGATLGTTAGSYIYPMEVQGRANHNIRLQTALYRRAASASSEWLNTSYRIQYAVDNSFTDGGKAFIELGGSDPTSNGGGFVSLGTEGADRLSILANGNVGIGTTTPVNKLDVSGTVRSTVETTPSEGIGTEIMYNAEQNRGLLVAYDRTASAYKRLDINDVIMVSGGGSLGNVGIGKIPTYKLDVAGAVGATDFLYTSDVKLKENINPLEGSLNKILELQGVSFNWKDNGEENIGLIAQDVEKVYPELVSTSVDGIKSVKYGNLVAPLIEAAKEQNKRIDEQQRQIDELKKEIERLKDDPRWF